MANSSFVQTDFRGGIWSASAQGRMSLDTYKTGMNESFNGMPMENGSWMRRPGFRYIGETRYGAAAVLKEFRYSKEEAYQAEFTAGFLRFVVGLSHLRDETTVPLVASITTSNPAVVVASPITGWANGDVVMFGVNTEGLEQPTTYQLFGRQFRIANVNVAASTFTLQSNFDNSNIDGSLIDYIPRATADTVQRVLTFTTPYTEDDLPYVRIVQTNTQSSKDVIVLCRQPGTIGHPPYILRQSGLTQFTFAAADFEDGPYFDQPADLINGFVNTLTLSASSGSVTVTAASTVGINDGVGFQATDVNRLIWFQGGPPAWSGAISYPKQYKVLGSDNNIYVSLSSGNLGNNPTTDAGTNWEISAESVQITWLKITAFTSTTVVTALIKGATLSTGISSTHWRLGVYSDTTGYPSCGGFHEGRLGLAGAVENRFDGSRNFKPLLFSPTEVDGTVSDDNAVSQTLNNKDAENISWMQSGAEGLAVGSLSGEWIISASALDDPITPTTVQARNVSTYGCAATEPIYAYGVPVFIQAATRKLMSHTRNYKGQYEALNHSEKAEALMAPGLAEVEWVQEPLLTMFCRRTDGALIGATHRVSLSQEQFTGWHRHEHSLGRIFESISAGPDFTGTSDSLFAVTWNNVGPRWIEVTMPVTSGGDPTWHAWHIDASTNAFYIRRMIVANGDSFDGIKIYGLYHLEGITVHPFVGGLDLGNFVVSSGSVSIPYAGAFTAAFLASFGNATDYGNWGIKLRWADSAITFAPAYPVNTISVIDDTAGSVSPSGDRLLLNPEMTKAWRIRDTSSGPTDNIRRFDAVDGTLVNEVLGADVVMNGTAGSRTLLAGTPFGRGWMYIPPDINRAGAAVDEGSLFGLVNFTGFTNSQYTIIDATTLRETFNLDHPTDINDADLNLNLSKEMFTVTYSSEDPSAPGSKTTNQLAVITSQLDSNKYNLMSIINLTADGPLIKPDVSGLTHNSLTLGQAMLFEDQITADGEQWGCRGKTFAGTITNSVGDRVFGNFTIFYTYGHTGTSGGGLPSATNVHLYQWIIQGGFTSASPWTITRTLIHTYAISDFDPTWTQANDVSFTYDATDENLICVINNFPTLSGRVLKVNGTNGDIIWNVSAPTAIPTHSIPTPDAGPWTRGKWAYMDDVASNINVLDFNTQTWSVAGTQTGFSVQSSRGNWFDEIGPSYINYSRFAEGVNTMLWLGPWATFEDPSWAVQEFNRIWLGGPDYTQDQEHREINADYYFVPGGVGVSYTSQGQLLRPDFGIDAGTRAGPAFGKIRRNHEYAMSVDRAFNMTVGTDFTTMYPVQFKSDGGTPYAAPALFTGTVADTLKDNYSFEGKIAWQVTRQYSCTVTAVGGFIMTQDH